MKRWQKILLIVVAVIAIDATKSFFVAKAHVPEHATARFKGMMFIGVWGVSFQYLGGPVQPTETFFVAPLLPIVTGKSMTK